MVVTIVCTRFDGRNRTHQVDVPGDRTVVRFACTLAVDALLLHDRNLESVHVIARGAGLDVIGHRADLDA